MKKEVNKEVETSGKIWGYVAGEGDSKIGARAPGPPEKGPKILKFFLKETWEMC